MDNKELIEFIKEARRRGFSDLDIKDALISRNLRLSEIEKAFSKLGLNLKYKQKVSIYLDPKILQIVERRAKKNLFKTEEQIEDIVRRSCVNLSKIKQNEQKVDDLLISIFSRRKTGRKAKKRRN